MTDIKDLIANAPDDAEFLVLYYNGDDLIPCQNIAPLKALVQRLEQAEKVIQHYADTVAGVPNTARAYLSEGEKKPDIDIYSEETRKILNDR